MPTKCVDCPLRRLDAFKTMTADEASFMQNFKTGELIADRGTEILTEGASSGQLYTALTGMGLRYKTGPDGRRQVIGFVLPGDFIGLQNAVMGVMEHSIEATTRMTLCVFNRSEFWDFFRSNPERAFDITRLAAREEQLLGEAILTIGQMDGVTRVSWALLRFYWRLKSLDMERNGRVPLPYRQQDLADAVGLSLVHTNKTLTRLRKAGLATWQDDALVVHKEHKLAELAKLEPDTSLPRPLI